MRTRTTRSESYIHRDLFKVVFPRWTAAGRRRFGANLCRGLCDPLSQENCRMTSGPLLDNGLPPISASVSARWDGGDNVELVMQGKPTPDTAWELCNCPNPNMVSQLTTARDDHSPVLVIIRAHTLFVRVTSHQRSANLTLSSRMSRDLRIQTFGDGTRTPRQRFQTALATLLSSTTPSRNRGVRFGELAKTSIAHLFNQPTSRCCGSILLALSNPSYCLARCWK